MDFGICLQSVVPLRSEPSHRAEMVTQLLFGELLRVISFNKEWALVQLAYDDYQGWILSDQTVVLSESEFLVLLNAETGVSHDLVQLISNETTKTILPIILGSSLPGIRDRECSIIGENYYFDGSINIFSSFESKATPVDYLKAKQNIVNDALLYINAPYLWGGRSPFGIDCSGFTQMVYKLQKIKLLRDANQQATQGETLNFINEAEPGDLAFFDDEEEKIIHVGMIMDSSRIIHASGKVRIDSIDHQGIFNKEEQRYSHNLRVIKRIV